MQCNRSLADGSPASRFISIRRSNAMRRYSTLILLLLLTACLLGSKVAATEATQANKPVIVITPTVGPPTTNVMVSGTGFDPNVVVDIYFDKTDLALATTDANGAFGTAPVPNDGNTGIPVQVPAAAVPGTHWITAVERSSQNQAQKPFLVQTNWAQFRFSPDHKGVNPYENVLSPNTVENLTLHWTYDTGVQPYEIESSPSVAKGVVYFGGWSDSKMYALNAGTGTLLWKHQMSSGVQSSPAVANGMVYAGAENAFALDYFAWNATTGLVRWKFESSDEYYPYSSPAVTNGVMYFGTGPNYGTVYALNASTGAQLWKSRMGSMVFSSPAVVNGVVYVGTLYPDHSVYALSADTGALRWQYPSTDAIWSSPAVANGVVYIGSDNGYLYALNADTGSLLWSYATGSNIRSSPAVASGVVYIGSGDANLYALNASTGALLWKFTALTWIDSSPAVANGVVYFGSHDCLYALNASTGAALWTYPVADGVFASPAVADGVVYFGSEDGKLYAFGLPSGQSSKKFSPPARPDPTLLVPDWNLKPRAPVTQMPTNLQE